MPPPDPFDPDAYDDPWADDPDAPKEPGIAADGDGDDGDDGDADPGIRGPAGLFDPELRGTIENEILFQQTMKAVDPGPIPPPPPPPRALLLMPVAVIAGASVADPNGPRQVALLAAAVVMHDIVAVLAGRLLGHRDRGLPVLAAFFRPTPVPAVAAGRRAAALLAGPLLGLAAGLAGFLLLRPAPGTWPFAAFISLTAVNALLLSPITTLPGGKAYAAVFLPGRPWAGTVFRMMAVAATVIAGVIAWDWKLVLPLGTVAAAILLTTPHAHRAARSRLILRRFLPGVPAEWPRLTDADRRRAFGLARVVRSDEFDPDELAVVVREVHARATAPAAGRATVVVVMAAVGAGWAAGLAAFAIAAGGG